MKRKPLSAKAKAALRHSKWGKWQVSRVVRIPDLIINVAPNPYRHGPYFIKTIMCPRRRNGETVVVAKRAIVDCAGATVLMGPRKWLDKQLAKYELGYARYCMTKGTEAEGL